MKPIFSFFVLLLSGSALSGQAVTIDTKPAKVSYYRMPDTPLDASYTTYSADLDIPFSQLGKAELTESYIVDKYLRLEGYKKVTSKGDLEITATIGDFMIWMETRGTTRTKTKDKDGKEEIKVRYQMELKYSLPVALQVYTREGTSLIDRYVMTNSNTHNWTSTSYNSLSDLESYWRINRASRLTQLHKELLEKGMRTISDEINNRFGYPKISDNVRFETVGKKKHELHDLFEKNMLIIIEAFSLMDADKGLDEIKAKIKPALTFYAAEVTKYKTANKDDERLRHICLFNQALAYFWTEEFDKAKSITDDLHRKDSKDKDAKRLLENIDETMDSLSRAGRTTRHKVVVGSRT